MRRPRSMGWLTRSLRAFENQQSALAALASIPGAVFCLVLLAINDYSAYAIAFAAIVLGSLCALGIVGVRARAAFSYRTLANLLETLASGDFSLRGRSRSRSDTFDEVVMRINALADQLAAQSLKTRESELLLQKVTDQIDIAVFALNRFGEVSFVNPAGLRLLDKQASAVVGTTAHSIGLGPLVGARSSTVHTLRLGSQSGRFHVSADYYVEGGRNYQLLLVTDLQHILFDEERRAWQNLVRVLSHEINNSLSPISSLGATIDELADDTEEGQQIRRGAQVIVERSRHLIAFIRGYSRLTHLAAPQKVPVSLKTLFKELMPLMGSRTITLRSTEDLEVHVDPGQMQQLLINLLKNADEATTDPEMPVEIAWHQDAGSAVIEILDQGAGIANTENLFVPFYSTKGRGSGIGLALCRQIVSNHYGRLTLENRDDQQGAKAIIALPSPTSA